MQSILSHRLLSTRGGTVVLGAVAALLAAVILLVYLNRYRDSVNSTSAPTTVLVARNLIPKGTSGALIGTKTMFQTATLPADQVKEGAVTDPALLRGRVAVADIYPGQQLTVADFSVTTTEAVSTKITGDQRAIALAVDSAHGNIGQLQTGDRVDVWASFKLEDRGNGEAVDLLSLIAPNVLVLSAPAPAGEDVVAGNSSQNVVLRLTSKQSAKAAFMSDNGRLWFILRPRSGATPTKPNIVDAKSVLIGQRTLRVKEVAK